jgi:hypothetical protein
LKSVGWKRRRTLSPGFGQPVIAVNDTVAPWSNLGQEDWAGQIRRTNCLLIDMRAVAVIRKFREIHSFNMEAIPMLLDERQKPSDIELEDPVWVHLISRLYGTRLKSLLQSQSGRQWTALQLRHDYHRLQLVS